MAHAMNLYVNAPHLLAKFNDEPDEVAEEKAKIPDGLVKNLKPLTSYNMKYISKVLSESSDMSLDTLRDKMIINTVFENAHKLLPYIDDEYNDHTEDAINHIQSFIDEHETHVAETHVADHSVFILPRIKQWKNSIYEKYRKDNRDSLL